MEINEERDAPWGCIPNGPEPYYQDDLVTLYHGDALEVLPTLDAPVAALLTDPPYFKVKEDEWDNQWDKASDFLGWVGDWLDLCKPLVAANGSVWVFASPALTSSVERVVAGRFKVLNSIRWVKQAGWHQKADLGAVRRFTSPWEGIVFAEQYHDVYSDQCKALHKQVFAPIGRYIQTERERAGWTRSDLEVALGYVSRSDPARGTALCYRWEEGSSLPTAEAYRRMRDVLNGAGGDYLRREYEDLRREYEDLRRPFTVTDRALSTDVWTYPTVAPYLGKHPCEKPLVMVEHMIRVSTRPGETILDPFAGSGTTLRAAANLGRKAIGVELDERYCEVIAKRLGQYALALDLGSV